MKKEDENIMKIELTQEQEQEQVLREQWREQWRDEVRTHRNNFKKEMRKEIEEIIDTLQEGHYLDADMNEFMPPQVWYAQRRLSILFEIEG